MAQGREGERVGGVVGQVEPALDRDGGVRGILEAGSAGLDQVVEVALRAGLPL